MIAMDGSFNSSVALQKSTLGPSSPVLEFDGVSLPHTWPYDTALDDVRFAIHPGELMLITLAPGRVRSPFADLAQGLIDPHLGQVRIAGRSWTEMTIPQMARHRSRGGRVFDVGGWVSNLNVDENVLLAQRHHRTAPAAQLRRQADELARSFGMDGVPTRRPAEASQNELRLSQWVRAFLGDMHLLVLERPARDVQPEAIEPFLRSLRAAREKGTAVLWITTHGALPGFPQNLAPPDITATCAMQGTSLVQVPNSVSL